MALNAFMTAVVLLAGVALALLHAWAGLDALGMIYLGLGADPHDPLPVSVTRGYIELFCAVLCLSGGFIILKFKRAAMICFIVAGTLISVAFVPEAFPNGFNLQGLEGYLWINTFIGFLPHFVLAVMSYLLWRRTKAREPADRIRSLPDSPN